MDPRLLAEHRRRAAADYVALLARFPERRQGYGREPTFPGTRAQPMTYALVLMAEARRSAVEPTEDGRRRVRSAARWLIRSRDLDRDGAVGWGLPDAWDAFGDGVGAAGDRNPANYPYTITTALVVEALTDAAGLDVWSERERAAIGETVGRAVDRWCREVFTSGADGGHFWYSPFAGDAMFCPNVSAMALGAFARATAAFAGDGLAWTRLPFVHERIDEAAEGIVNRVEWHEGTPYWRYIEDWPRRRLNDAVHHGYVIWGMDRYRESGGAVPLGWGVDRAVDSFRAFETDGRLVDLPPFGDEARAGRPPVPMRLWGAGMILAVLARLGAPAVATGWADRVRDQFGPPAELSLHAGVTGEGRPFYPRHAAHLLLGLAEVAFPPAGA